MERVEEISDDGKFIIKAGDSHYSVNVTFTLLSVDDLTDDGVFDHVFVVVVSLKRQFHATLCRASYRQ